MGVIAVMSGTKMKRLHAIASFQLFIVVPKHDKFVPAGFGGGIKLLHSSKV